jgi:hypothetical protein
MTHQTYHDPHLGHLTWDEDRPDTLVGIAALTPKHPVRVSLDVPANADEPAIESVVAHAGKLFVLLQGRESVYRQQLANLLQHEAERHGHLQLAGKNIEEISRLFTLREVHFFEPSAWLFDGGAVLRYDENTGFPLRPDVGVRIGDDGPSNNVHLIPAI